MSATATNAAAVGRRNERAFAELIGGSVALIAPVVFFTVPLWKGKIRAHWTQDEADWWVDRYNRELRGKLGVSDVEAVAPP